MPQTKRSSPLCTKTKKHQMLVKNHQKSHFLLTGNASKHNQEEKPQGISEFGQVIKKINKQPRDNSGKSRYALQFFHESAGELERRKEEAKKKIELFTIEQQEVSDDYFPTAVDMPKRPKWDTSMSKEELEIREQRYFTEYLKRIESLANVSYFELNLETWRQLWRVIEMSDVLLIIVDIRYPVMMFPPYLYDYITNEKGKDMILILNKIDLASASLVLAWQHYFKTQYPKLHILVFTSFPTYNLKGKTIEEKGLNKRRKKGKLRMAAEGAQKIMETCRDIVGDKVDLTSWEKKIEEEMNLEYEYDDLDEKDNITIEKRDTSYFEHEKFKNGILTIGCIGTPNVGKSSLINALMGKKVVSVSRTPGHTKHFQTILITKNVCLTDCPGLVFPSIVPKQFQILMGSFPIAQVREPYSAIKFLAERINLPQLLKLQHQDNDTVWSAIDVCDGWAAKRNFRTAKAARLDTYRAANYLLRMALEGKICIHAYPPKWSSEKDTWEAHPDVKIIKWIQAKSHNDGSKISESADSLSEFEEDDDKVGNEVKPNSKQNREASSDEEISKISNKFQILSAE